MNNELNHDRYHPQSPYYSGKVEVETLTPCYICDKEFEEANLHLHIVNGHRQLYCEACNQIED